MNQDTFFNVTEGKMSFETVIKRLKHFISKESKYHYILSIGTDSHVHKNETRFITAIHLHRVGKGAWGCLRSYTIPRAIQSLREKISYETMLSQEVAYLFTSGYLEELVSLLLPYERDGADFTFQIHLDIGRKGMTKELINEMTSKIAAMGIEPIIKPEAYAAFSYANRYTK
jgi:uncharacterized protein